MARRQDSDILG